MIRHRPCNRVIVTREYNNKVFNIDREIERERGRERGDDEFFFLRFFFCFSAREEGWVGWGGGRGLSLLFVNGLFSNSV